MYLDESHFFWNILAHVVNKMDVSLNKREKLPGYISFTISNIYEANINSKYIYCEMYDEYVENGSTFWKNFVYHPVNIVPVF